MPSDTQQQIEEKKEEIRLLKFIFKEIRKLKETKTNKKEEVILFGLEKELEEL